METKILLRVVIKKNPNHHHLRPITLQFAFSIIQPCYNLSKTKICFKYKEPPPPRQNLENVQKKTTMMLSLPDLSQHIIPFCQAQLQLSYLFYHCSLTTSIYFYFVGEQFAGIV